MPPGCSEPKAPRLFESLGTLRVYFRAIGTHRGRALFTVVVNAAATIFEGAALVVLLPLIDLVMNGAGGRAPWLVDIIRELLSFAGLDLTIPVVVSVFAALGACSAILVFIASFSINALGVDFRAALQGRMFSVLMAMEWPAFARLKSGALTKTVLFDTDEAGRGIIAFVTAAGMAASIVVYGVLTLLVSWRMTIVTGLFVVAAIPVYLRLTHGGERSARRATAAAETMTGQGTDLLLNAKLLFSQGRRATAIARFVAASDDLRRASLRRERAIAAVRLTFELGAVLFISAFLFVALWLQNGSIATAFVFLVIFYRLAPRVVTLQTMLFRAVTFGASLERWQQRYDEATEARAPAGDGIEPRFDDAIELRDVGFRFARSDAPVLRAVNLRVGARECVGLVGPSGHGKTTLLDLVTGLLQPTEGEIVVDGTPLAALDLRAWQQRIGVVLQDSPMFHASIAENIAFGGDGIDPERLRRAARLAGALAFVQAMPAGFETVIGDRGARLSGGQRQRLALARALYGDPWLVILDEATSALEAESTAAVVASLRRLKGRVAMLIVSHQEEILALADRLYEVSDGRLGEHDATTATPPSPDPAMS